MSCAKVLECITDKPISSGEIRKILGIEASYIGGCLANYVKQGRVIKTKLEDNNQLGPRTKYVYTLANPVKE